MRGVNFTKEIPLIEISANLKNMLKKVRGVNFSKELPFTLKVQHLLALKITKENPLRN